MLLLMSEVVGEWLLRLHELKLWLELGDANKLWPNGVGTLSLSMYSPKHLLFMYKTINNMKGESEGSSAKPGEVTAVLDELSWKNLQSSIQWSSILFIVLSIEACTALSIALSLRGVKWISAKPRDIGDTNVRISYWSCTLLLYVRSVDMQYGGGLMSSFNIYINLDLAFATSIKYWYRHRLSSFYIQF